MRPGKARVSCVPCAKRKVRCDRLQPCCHCRRRPQDACEYPTEALDKRESLDVDRDRVAVLEDYIRRLGGDPKQADRGLATPSQSTSQSPRFDQDVSTGQTSESRRQSQIGPRLTQKTTSALVDHGDDGPAYIETPTWLTWQNDDFPLEDAKHRKDAMIQAPVSYRTILDRNNVIAEDELPHLLDGLVKSLWATFLTNAHPLIKIFFDWEIAPIINKADCNINNLRSHESALVAAISFISSLTLTEEQCQELWGRDKPQMVMKLQHAAETALLRADYAGTTKLMTLQALVLYLIGLPERARPTILFSLWSIASRVAERMGVHRNGEPLGLSVLRSEERRRLWWQIQVQEIYAGRLIGKVNLMLLTDWDATIPANIDDGELDVTATALPAPRKVLTSMSACLWLYRLFQMHRQTARGSHSRLPGVSPWTIFSDVPVAEKDQLIEEMESSLRVEFLQFCDLLDPLHLYIQLGINNFVVSARRAARQPALINAKISEMSLQKRDELLNLCVKTMEYYILFNSTEALRRFRWYGSFSFQMLALIYIILEVHHRRQEDSAKHLWSIIERVYAVHPTLAAVTSSPETMYVSRITLAAWRGRTSSLPNTGQDPAWIVALDQRCESGAVQLAPMLDQSAPKTQADVTCDFDFDLIDWSAWAEFEMTHVPT